MSAVDSTVRHVAENLHMFGFGNAESAMLQCVKELFDNSLDSLKDTASCTASLGNIQISMTGARNLQ
jgi:DNA topoisomerase VI subunit B